MDRLGGRVNLPATSELTIAIVSGGTEFARSLMARWQSERMIPGFIALAVEAAFGLLTECDLVVVGDVPKERLPQLLKALDPSARP